VHCCQQFLLFWCLPILLQSSMLSLSSRNSEHHFVTLCHSLRLGHKFPRSNDQFLSPKYFLHTRTELPRRLLLGPLFQSSSHVQLTRTHNMRQMAGELMCMFPAKINKSLQKPTIILRPLVARFYALYTYILMDHPTCRLINSG
jgi:hypothetical protein